MVISVFSKPKLHKILPPLGWDKETQQGRDFLTLNCNNKCTKEQKAAGALTKKKTLCIMLCFEPKYLALRA